MAFQIEIAPLALQDLEEAYLWFAQYSPQRAAEWFNEITAAIYSLETHPSHCALAPEEFES